MSSEVK